jgi:mannose-6-phosphate isomerase-like protein (cupin superfamily)
MMPLSDTNRTVARLVKPDEICAYNVLGPLLEILTQPAGDDRMPCTMRGTIPPGITVPIHSHADPETYVAVSGTVEALAEETAAMVWIEISPGDVFHVPGNAKHAFRNRSHDPSVMFIVSTEKIARFFRAIGEPVERTDLSFEAPSAEAIRNFLSTAEAFGYWNATPEENARAGIQVSPQ